MTEMTTGEDGARASLSNAARSAAARSERNLSRSRARTIVAKRLCVCAAAAFAMGWGELLACANAPGPRSDLEAGVLAGVFTGLMAMAAAALTGALLLWEGDAQ